MPIYAVQMPGVPEMVVILVIVLILFGAGRLPAVFEQLGKGIKSFKDAQKEEPTDVTPPKEIDQKAGISEAREVKDRAARG